MAHGSWPMAQGSWFVLQGSWLKAKNSLALRPPGPRWIPKVSKFLSLNMFFFWFLGFLVSWFLGFLVSCFIGFLVSKFYGLLFFGFSVFCFLVSKFQGLATLDFMFLIDINPISNIFKILLDVSSEFPVPVFSTILEP